ncbi:TPA: hypothetical protein CPT80_02020 [Candidatus Gastranaerophilales bacterium HUM_9]|nr:MAG TPA: hypothetical protein CPT80_02020 [Candidatus Gastranaerophilales bacterium HUM_9]HBX34243.1 hypothetical protein [Cyanobacteria bacterium UBA11440]
MNKNTIILLLIFVLPLITYFYVSKNNESTVTVSNTTKPKIIKFTSTLCGECQRMDTVIKEVYPKYQKDIELISVPVQNQTEYNQEMISKYNVTLVPTIVLLNKNQHIQKRIEGYIDRTTFDNYLREIK